MSKYHARETAEQADDDTDNTLLKTRKRAWHLKRRLQSNPTTWMSETTQQTR